jgi:tetratricopeptide (TPR) repeat protein
VHPNNAQVNYAYAVSLWKRTQTAAADDATLLKVQKHLLRAVQLDPKLTDAHFQLALLYEQRGELSSAIRELEIAVRLEPGAPLYHYRLGHAYNAAHIPGKGMEQLRIFRELKESPAGSKPQK